MGEIEDGIGGGCLVCREVIFCIRLGFVILGWTAF